MLAMSAILGWQFEQMRRSVQTVGHILAVTPPDAATTYRDGGTGWSVLQVVCHLRDFEDVFLHRATLTVYEDFPDLPSPKPDELAAERRYQDQKLNEAYDQWARNRESFLQFFDQRREDDWERPANHPTRGRFTLHDQLFLTVWHDNNHLEQITRILAEKL